MAELRSLRADQVQACEAETGREDQLHDDLTALGDKLDKLDVDQGDVRTSIDAVTAAVNGIGVDDAHAVHVTQPPAERPAAGTEDSPSYVELADPSATQLDDGFRALHGDVWVLAGLVGALCLGVLVVRAFMGGRP